MKKGQITIFIIIGLVLLLIFGTYLYLSGKQEQARLEAAKPKLVSLPSKLQPIRDAMEQCIHTLALEGIKRLGETGGYLDDSFFRTNAFQPTEGDAVQLSPRAGPNVAYWYYMKSKNSCTSNCEFASKRPPLRARDGQGSIETQLNDYFSKNIPSCLEGLNIPGCTVQPTESPTVETTLSENVYVTLKYPVRATCEEQNGLIEDYATSVDVNLPQLYELATNLTTFEMQEGMLEQATTTILQTFSGIDSNKLPPYRDLEVGPPKPGTFWVKFDVRNKIGQYLQSYIPLIQVFGTKNYQYIAAPSGIRDDVLYEMIYNRQFLIPLNNTYPSIEASFHYLDWWTPYFDLNCNGEVCGPDTGSNFYLLPLTINRYEFAYDLSYPVMVELRDVTSLGGEGYIFRFFLEENMRSSKAFKPDSTTILNTPIIDPDCVQKTIQHLQEACVNNAPANTYCNSDWALQKATGLCAPPEIPGIFCNPNQRTSGDISLYIKNSDTKFGLENVSVSYLCGDNNCNLGLTTNGTFSSKFPRCIGGAFKLTKPEFQSYTRSLDTFDEEPKTFSITLEPIRTLNVTIRNYPITKEGKDAPWRFEEAIGLVRPKQEQQTLIVLTRQEEPYSEPFVSFADLEGTKSAELRISPGKYHVQITSLLHKPITIPVDHRCFKMGKMGIGGGCQDVPDKPITFNQTSPFPLSSIEYDYEFTPEMLRNAKSLEFRQYILDIAEVPEEQRVIEDLGEIDKNNLYAKSNPSLIWPVVNK